MFNEIGISTWAFEKMPVAECLPIIDQLGFPSVEIWGYDESHFDPRSDEGVSKVVDALSSSNLKADSLHAPFGRIHDISSLDETSRAATVKLMLRCVEAASRLSLDSLVIHPGHLMGPGEEPSRYKAATDSLEEICGSAEPLGVRVCVENLFSDENHFVFCDTLPKLLHLVRSVEGPRPGICVDTSHGNVMGHVSEDIEICGEAVQRTHISDNFGVHDDHLPPGDGEIPWSQVLTSLHRVSYPGPLTLEIAGAGEPEARIIKAREQLVGIISEWKP